MNINEIVNLSEIGEWTGKVIPEIATGIIAVLFTQRKEQKNLLDEVKKNKYTEIADVLLKEGELTYYEYFKCRNYLKVAKKADEFFKNHKLSSESLREEFDFDWYLRFFEACSMVSNEEMQTLWGRVLSGEVEHKGSFSLRTIETLSRMTRVEAIAFQEIANVALRTLDGMWFVICEGTSTFDMDQIDDLIVPNERIRMLQEVGLINPIKSDMITWFSMDKIKSPVTQKDTFGLTDGENLLLFRYNGVMKGTQDKIKKEKAVVFPYYPLTEAGRQLLSVVKREREYAYILELKDAINHLRGKQNRDVTAHKIIEEKKGEIWFRDL